MTKIIRAFLALQLVSAVSLLAATTPSECGLCGGLALRADQRPAAVVLQLIRLSEGDLAATAELFSSMAAQQRAKTTIVIGFSLEEGDSLLQIERHATAIVDWASKNGPFDALGIAVENAEPSVAAFAIKRLAILTQGLGLAKRIVTGPIPEPALSGLFEAGANPYFDEILADSSSFASTLRFVLDKDPSKKVSLVTPVSNTNRFYDIARGFQQGAWRVFLESADPDRDAISIAALNRELTGDVNFDSSSTAGILDATGNRKSESPLVFVRGEDLRRIAIPPGDPSASNILTLSLDDYTRVRRVDGSGERVVTDTGRKGARYLVGFPPQRSSFLLTIDREARIDPKITRDTISVVTDRGITVEEIIRNHQAERAFQETIEPRYIALNSTKLRFTIGEGGEAIEATLAGDYFSEPSAASDWVWEDFLINGVKWKYGRVPELPLIQPEKVTRLPLDLQLTNDYRYQLAGQARVNGFDTWEVRFEPPLNADAKLPIYRGTVWIDKKTWARIRISMIQLNLSGEVLSSEERVDFTPFHSESQQPLSAAQAGQLDSHELMWLPQSVTAQQVLSTSGRSTVVLRATDFSNFRIRPADWDLRRQSANLSNSRMVRETERGLRYLEKNGAGERVVKDEFDTSRLFLLGGLHHDAGLEFPVVPLGGLDYFNFNLGGTGIQANVFFAGVIVSASATHPAIGGTRTNAGADFFGIALPFANSMYRDGREVVEETVKTLPLRIRLKAGHPVFQFGKIDVGLDLSHLSYQRAEETAGSFLVPQDTFVLSPSIEARYDRWGYSVSGSYEYGYRTRWKPWGLPEEYDEKQKRFHSFGVSGGKSIYLPRFQRLGLEVNYLDGRNLDRFSKYELGFFGARRIRGVKSGSVRAERAVLGHISYGFVFSQQFRLEAFYDHGLIDDESSGYSREPFQGIGLGGQTLGPWGTILRTDFGKSIGRNAQDGFVASVILLKLF